MTNMLLRKGILWKGGNLYFLMIRRDSVQMSKVRCQTKVLGSMLYFTDKSKRIIKDGGVGDGNTVQCIYITNTHKLYIVDIYLDSIYTYQTTSLTRLILLAPHCTSFTVLFVSPTIRAL